MDALDEVLGTVRVRDSMVGRSRVTPPWSLLLASGDPFLLVAMATGTGWLLRDGHAPMRLEAGSVAVAVCSGPIVVADDPATQPTVVITGAEACVDAATGEDVRSRDRTGSRTWGPPDAPMSVLLGSYATDGERFRMLCNELPELVVVHEQPTVAPIVAGLIAESERYEPGQQVMFDRLMELLLFSTVRAWLRSPQAQPASWYRALGDEAIGPALQAIHDDPARPWTVAELAAVTTRSRATFARRFRDVVGEPPLAYATRWRMAWAADLLADGRSVQSVARRVGYADAFSFSTAFRRVRGIAPSVHRRSATPVTASAAADPIHR